jgi:hypothetical protein
MKLAGLILIASFAAPLCAHAESPAQCTRAWDEVNKAQGVGVKGAGAQGAGGKGAGADSYKSFMLSCLSNRLSPTTPRINRPAGAPADAAVRCRDGFYSQAVDPARACAPHRGVLAVLR